MRLLVIAGAAVAILITSAGCSPVGAVVQVGMYATQKIIDDADTKKLAQELIGRSPGAADERLGQRVDTFQDVNSSRQWISYPVKLDPLHMQRYLVEEINNRIVRIEKVHQETSEVDIARALYYEAIVKGKPPREVEQKLKAGPPELTVRSTTTGQWVQLYNGKLIADIGDQKWIVVRYGADGLCSSLRLVAVGATQTTASGG
jgi:hypothetical protein